MKTARLGDILTVDELKTVLDYHKKYSDSEFASKVCANIIEPNINRINKATGQENVPMYIAYMIQHQLCIAEQCIAEQYYKQMSDRQSRDKQ